MYPFATEIKKKQTEHKKNQGIIDDLYNKIKDNFKDRVTEVIAGYYTVQPGQS